ncbi:DNA polymerase III subunit delta' [Caulobacter mirabilis]|uniref:DNA polymerase III subunit delta n=1 Tax=Caulobacter mirabilis TaxID=69666 RepID=A0A2D2AXZ7_9CAUL|nr:DNA polymerase III subunit delta' [Caulobacter mirabilis]ATQ42898.1 DNA polymerase III subunit delta' [Caulobacter mirabilis]
MADFPDPPHPRDAFALEGAAAQEGAFLDALERGRLHHAWLLTGPEGVGKATFAFRAARRLLGATPDPNHGLLGARMTDPVVRQIAVRSHPDLLVLERFTEDGKPRKVIPVDEARKLPEFFAQTPATAPYRVAIIDAADDLNVNAANAILKTLEEPPPRGVLFLVSHSPGRLLPTIRSRCRRLAFGAPGEAVTAEFVESRTGLSPEQSLRLARMAGGAPGLALRLAAADALAADDEAHEILRNLPKFDDGALVALADRFRGPEGQQRFNLLIDRISDQIRAMAVGQAVNGGGEGLDRWVQAWERLQALPDQTEGLNLDHADAFWTALRELRAAARAA